MTESQEVQKPKQERKPAIVVLRAERKPRNYDMTKEPGYYMALGNMRRYMDLAKMAITEYEVYSENKAEDKLEYINFLRTAVHPEYAKLHREELGKDMLSFINDDEQEDVRQYILLGRKLKDTQFKEVEKMMKDKKSSKRSKKVSIKEPSTTDTDGEEVVKPKKSSGRPKKVSIRDPPSLIEQQVEEEMGASIEELKARGPPYPPTDEQLKIQAENKQRAIQEELDNHDSAPKKDGPGRPRKTAEEKRKAQLEYTKKYNKARYQNDPKFKDKVLSQKKKAYKEKKETKETLNKE